MAEHIANSLSIEPDDFEMGWFAQHGSIGNPNTMKLELPETLNLNQPMARFERTPQGIVYEVYDLGTPGGNQIMAALEDGRRDNTTQMTISDPERATWWRFI